jgi:spore coat protein CotH
MYVREVYCYDLFERYGVWTAPQSSYTRLKLKIREDKDTVYYGVYQIQEPVNIDYLKSRKEQFGDADGFLWKANWGADFRKPNSSLMNVENVTLESVYTPVYDLKTNTENLFGAQQVLMSFITNLNTKTGNDFKAWISSATDVPLFLKTYAVSVLCGMWDDYWVNKNNFYFYFNSQGKFFFIPFDYDNTLGTSLIMKDSGRQDLLNWGNSSYPLVKKIIDIPEYRALYISYIRELCNKENDLFHHSKSTTRIANWHNMIRNHISNDTGEDMEIEDKPASWGNCGFYRLQGNSNNYFQIRAANIP